MNKDRFSYLILGIICLRFNGSASSFWARRIVQLWGQFVKFEFFSAFPIILSVFATPRKKLERAGISLGSDNSEESWEKEKSVQN